MTLNIFLFVFDMKLHEKNAFFQHKNSQHVSLERYNKVQRLLVDGGAGAGVGGAGGGARGGADRREGLRAGVGGGGSGGRVISPPTVRSPRLNIMTTFTNQRRTKLVQNYDEKCCKMSMCYRGESRAVPGVRRQVHAPPVRSKRLNKMTFLQKTPTLLLYYNNNNCTIFTHTHNDM